MEVQSPGHAPRIEVVWSPATSEPMDFKLVEPYLRKDDSFMKLSKKRLRSFSELQAGNIYLAFGGESRIDTMEEKEEDAGAPTQKAARREVRDLPHDQQQAEAATGGSPPAGVATEKRMEIIDLANCELMKSMNKMFEEIRSLKDSQELEKKRVSNVIEFLQLTGTSPISVAYSLAEFALETAGATLRKVVAEFFLKPVRVAMADEERWLKSASNLKPQSKGAIEQALMKTEAMKWSTRFRDDMEVFKASFTSGFIEDVDFCRATIWEFNATRDSLAVYWGSLGYHPEQPPCSNWDDPKEAGQAMTKNLKDWLRATERELAGRAGVAPDELRKFIGIYATAARLKRNAQAHFFSVFASVTRKNPSRPTGTQRPKDAKEFSSRLKAALVTPHKLVELDELQRMHWALGQLRKQAHQLDSFFREHSEAFLGLMRMLESEEFPALVHSAIKAASEDGEKAARFGLSFNGESFRKAGTGTFKYVLEKVEGGAERSVLMQFKEEAKAFVPNPDGWKLLLGV